MTIVGVEFLFLSFCCRLFLYFFPCYSLVSPIPLPSSPKSWAMCLEDVVRGAAYVDDGPVRYESCRELIEGSETWEFIEFQRIVVSVVTMPL